MTTRKRKPELKEVTIFPMSCEKGHSFKPLRKNDDGEVEGYYKKDEKDERIKDKVYCILYCSQCGTTKEIVMVNYRRD